MSRQDRDRERPAGPADDRTRRAFVALSAAAGWVGASRSTAGTPPDTVERDVEIRTADGLCDAAFIYPVVGAHPGVLIWTDIFGLRPSMREFGHRLAAAGYAVLVPNPFYRTTRAPVLGGISAFSFRKETDRDRRLPPTGPSNAAEAEGSFSARPAGSVPGGNSWRCTGRRWADIQSFNPGAACPAIWRSDWKASGPQDSVL